MEDEKYIDESWKDAVAEEKRKAAEQAGASASSAQQEGRREPPRPQRPHRPQPSRPEQSSESSISFQDYVTSLAFQAMIFLGEVPHPATQKNEKDLHQAKLLIDTLILLRDKTAGNLSKDEEDNLNAVLYELQMRFVELTEKNNQ